jgi:hypothetical protein
VHVELWERRSLPEELRESKEELRRKVGGGGIGVVYEDEDK